MDEVLEIKMRPEHLTVIAAATGMYAPDEPLNVGLRVDELRRLLIALDKLAGTEAAAGDYQAAAFAHAMRRKIMLALEGTVQK